MSVSEYVEHINEHYESADDVGVPTNKNDGAPEEGAVYVNSAEAAGALWAEWRLGGAGRRKETAVPTVRRSGCQRSVPYTRRFRRNRGQNRVRVNRTRHSDSRNRVK